MTTTRSFWILLGTLIAPSLAYLIGLLMISGICPLSMILAPSICIRYAFYSTNCSSYLKSAFFLKKRETCDTVAHYVDLIVPFKTV